MPVASGGIHPGNLHWNIAFLGTDITVNLGGGIHGHPDGTGIGAKAARQALDAILEGVPLTEAAERHPELKRALQRWSYVPIPAELENLRIWWPK
jgi:ribulose-bisphosphate carboxylase large chain